jgi:hypothetical protein
MNQVCLDALSDPSLGRVKSIGLQQLKDQSHQFTGCKRKGRPSANSFGSTFFWAWYSALGCPSETP